MVEKTMKIRQGNERFITMHTKVVSKWVSLRLEKCFGIENEDVEEMYKFFFLEDCRISLLLIWQLCQFRVSTATIFVLTLMMGMKT